MWHPSWAKLSPTCQSFGQYGINRISFLLLLYLCLHRPTAVPLPPSVVSRATASLSRSRAVASLDSGVGSLRGGGGGGEKVVVDEGGRGNKRCSEGDGVG